MEYVHWWRKFSRNRKKKKVHLLFSIHMLHLLTCIPWVLHLFLDNIKEEMMCLWQANIDLIVFCSLSRSSPASISHKEKNPPSSNSSSIFFAQISSIHECLSRETNLEVNLVLFLFPVCVYFSYRCIIKTHPMWTFFLFLSLFLDYLCIQRDVFLFLVHHFSSYVRSLIFTQ